MESNRVLLGIDDFRALVRGEIVEVVILDGTLVEIALSDIGWESMIGAITEAVQPARTEQTKGEGRP